jgi:hypothetical protein
MRDARFVLSKSAAGSFSIICFLILVGSGRMKALILCGALLLVAGCGGPESHGEFIGVDPGGKSIGQPQHTETALTNPGGNKAIETKMVNGKATSTETSPNAPPAPRPESNYQPQPYGGGVTATAPAKKATQTPAASDQQVKRAGQKR